MAKLSDLEHCGIFVSFTPFAAGAEIVIKTAIEWRRLDHLQSRECF
jgi:hypothetical protein